MPKTLASSTYELARLRRELKPFKLHWFPAVGSTNTHAATMRREGRLLAPSIVLTGRQTAGRGRGSNQWHSPRGVITATFVFPRHDTLAPQHVPLVAGLAIRNAVASFGLSEVCIKWPNDIWIEDRKLAGVLCERIGNIDLIGVGLNACADLKQFPAKVGPIATSMSAHLKAPLCVSTVLIEMARQLHLLLSDPRTSLSRILPAVRSADALLGRKIRVADSDQVLFGTYDGIDTAGRLLLRVRGRQLALFTGSVSLAKSGNR